MLLQYVVTMLDVPLEFVIVTIIMKATEKTAVEVSNNVNKEIIRILIMRLYNTI